jgi:ketosteroid isomerase-like protein
LSAICFGFVAGQIVRADQSSDDVLQAVKAWDKANVTGNIKAIGDLLLDNYVLTSSSSHLLTKQQVLTAESEPGLKYAINASTQVAVHRYGDTAVVTAVLEQKGVEGGKPFEYWFRYSDTWVKTPQGWKQLAGHATLLK